MLREKCLKPKLLTSIVQNRPLEPVLGLSTLPWYAGLFISLVVATIAICCVALIWVPRLKKEILGELLTQSGAAPSNGADAISLKAIKSRNGTGAYDNATFRADETPGGKQLVGIQRDPAAPPKQKRELTLDPQHLTGQAKDTDDQKASTSGSKQGPPVAAKPVHLRRQLAQDQQATGQQLDEIDLNGGGESSARDIESGAQVVAVEPSKSSSSSSPSVKPGFEPSYTFSGERQEVAKLFGSLQILTACFASFAHGTNDVSNAVAPLIPIWNIYTTGEENVAVQTQVWILAFGSIGICTGLWAWGRAVMATISDGLTKITPSKGFSVELGAAISVLVATKMGLPISTTHCKVGSLVIVGFVSEKFLAKDNLFNRTQQLQQRQQRRLEQAAAEGKQGLEIEEEDEAPGSEAVDWKLFGNIAITWVSTVPMAAAASAAVMYLLKWLTWA